MARKALPPRGEDMSPARLHGQACYWCGCVSGGLRPAGTITTDSDGQIREWSIVGCAAHRTDPPQETGIEKWLASAHEQPATPHQEWAARRLAMLPLGVRFDAVRIPADVLYAALVNVRPAGVAATLEQVLGGPVIQDAQRWFYPLVPVGPASRWRSREAEYLGSDTWLGVPQIDQLAPPGAYWVVPPRAPGRLCDLARVAELVAVGAARLTGSSR